MRRPILLRFKTATVQSGKGMQVHRGTTTFDRHAVGTSGEWVGMSGTPWVRYMDVPNMLFPACAMNKPLGVVELESGYFPKYHIVIQGDTK